MKIVIYVLIIRYFRRFEIFSELFQEKVHRYYDAKLDARYFARYATV